MYKIVSRRAQGTVVKIVEGGCYVNKPIRGQGFVLSESLTNDIRGQQRLKLIEVTDLSASTSKEAGAPPSLTIDPSVGAQSSATPQPRARPSKPKKEEYYSEEELMQMTKALLRDLADAHDIDVPSRGTKSEILDALFEYNIPKE